MYIGIFKLPPQCTCSAFAPLHLANAALFFPSPPRLHHSPQLLRKHSLHLSSHLGREGGKEGFKNLNHGYRL